MIRSKLSAKLVLLATGVGLSVAALAGSQPAAAQAYTCPVGSTYDPTHSCTVDDFGYYGYGYPYGAYRLHSGHKMPYRMGGGGGSSVTAGGLVFRGEPDGNFLALDAKTGKELWRFQTGFGADAPPVF